MAVAAAVATGLAVAAAVVAVAAMATAAATGLVAAVMPSRAGMADAMAATAAVVDAATLSLVATAVAVAGFWLDDQNYNDSIHRYRAGCIDFRHNRWCRCPPDTARLGLPRCARRTHHCWNKRRFGQDTSRRPCKRHNLDAKSLCTGTPRAPTVVEAGGATVATAAVVAAETATATAVAAKAEATTAAPEIPI